MFYFVDSTLTMYKFIKSNKELCLSGAMLETLDESVILGLVCLTWCDRGFFCVT